MYEPPREHKTTHTGGVGFCGALTIALVVLKLTGFIDWSWWWVFSPLWGAVLFVFLLMAVLLGGAALIDWLIARKNKGSEK